MKAVNVNRRKSVTEPGTAAPADFRSDATIRAYKNPTQSIYKSKKKGS